MIAKRIRLFLAATMALAAIPTVAWANQIATNGGASFPAQFFAPYVDVTLWPTPQFDQQGQTTRTKFYTLAFLDSDSSAATTPAWGGYDSYPVIATADDANASWDFSWKLINSV